ncbi:MAG: T9SS type A sorting domain-containing protein [Flavobacteriales bacterium]|nr:T9SS type A sorting domain-containing protein [Flavobacteriales bacterium]
MVACRELALFQFAYPNLSPISGSFPFGFGNSGDAVRLYHPSGLLVDKVDYLDSAPWPDSADGLGPTLELASPELDNALPENWNAWADRNGTPGAQNYLGTGNQEVEDVFSVSIFPNPLIDDQLSIRIRSTQSESAVITVRDLLGKTIFQRPLQWEPGISTMVMHPGISTSGIYLLHFESDSLDRTFKLIFTKTIDK